MGAICIYTYIETRGGKGIEVNDNISEGQWHHVSIHKLRLRIRKLE